MKLTPEDPVLMVARQRTGALVENAGNKVEVVSTAFAVPTKATTPDVFTHKFWNALFVAEGVAVPAAIFTLRPLE